MDKILNTISATVRRSMLLPAKVIHTMSRGRITPNHITLVSLLGHIGVVWALWQWRPVLAAILLAVFGIMDSLDGALARLQKKASSKGMFYDAMSDRAKEVLLYTGLMVYCFRVYDTYAISYAPTIENTVHDVLTHVSGQLPTVVLISAVYGLSFLISYAKAKGETALAQKTKDDPNSINRVFADGLGRYEVRMAIVIVGLLSGYLLTSLVVLLGVTAFTASQRFARISKALTHV